MIELYFTMPKKLINIWRMLTNTKFVKRFEIMYQPIFIVIFLLRFKKIWFIEL